MEDFKFDTAEEAKSKGNDFFQKKNYKSSVECYNVAINLSKLPSTSPETLAIYYNNRATANFNLEEYDKCIRDADYSISHNKQFMKAYYRKAYALYQIRKFQKAKQTIQEGLDICGKIISNEDITHLLSLIEEKLERLEHPQKDVLDFERKCKENVMDAENLERTQKLIETFNLDSKLGIEKSPEIPEFHLEYQKTYPQEDQHFKILKQLYWEAKSENLRILEITNKKFDIESTIGPEYFNKRFGGFVNKDVYLKIYGMKPGEIITEIDDYKSEKSKYSRNQLFHSFNNSSQMQMVLNYGKSYVSIGFTDLWMILNSELKGYGTSEGDAINLFLYDSCPFVCAKSKVLVEMFSDKQVKPESIFQVWFSSGWALEAEKAFLNACQTIMNNGKDIDYQVRCIIKEWLSSPQVTLAESRKQWFQDITPLEHDCYNLLQEIDRIEMAKYYLTGELLNAETGSRTMFLKPLSNYSRIKDECFIFSQNLMEIEDNKKSFLSSIIDHVLKRISSSQGRVQNKVFNVYINQKEISRDNIPLLDEIKAIKPWVVVWSNLCDYFPRNDFIYIAKYII